VPEPTDFRPAEATGLGSEAVPKPPARKKSRWRRRLTIAGVSVAVLGGATWIALHELPWFGPMMADAARSVLGPRAVAWMEDVVYGAEDRIHLAVSPHEPPKTFWEIPPPAEVPKPPDDGPPPAFDPPFSAVAATGDGTWIPVRAPNDDDHVALYKSLVHPDPKRPYAAVAVMAMDLRELELQMVAGTQEPESPSVPRSRRPGVVPEVDRGAVVAVFNGGFKAVHGSYGMRIGADTFLPPRDIACTIALTDNDGIRIRTYSAIQSEEPELIAYRQTPPCLVERGAPNKQLLNEFTKNWGASVSGETIIRRSAIGLSEDGRFLFYGLGDAVTARSIGAAMLAVGAYDAAQLDVNYSFPRMMLVEHDKDGSVELTAPLVPDLRYGPAEYLGVPSQRDFFYVKRKHPTS
jgi:hypothetical protein